jgi:restriction system protein
MAGKTNREPQRKQMAIPDFQTLMLPVLTLAGDGAEHSVSEFRQRIAEDLKLTPDELAEKLKNGTGLFANRLAWAFMYLRRAQLLNPAGRGVYRITDRGVALLRRNSPTITVKTLHEYPEIVDMYPKGRSASVPVALPTKRQELTLTPEEQLENSYQVLRDALVDEVLEVVKNSSPSGFEQIVVDLLVAMGYGGSLEEPGEVVGKSGDGGIDGTIKQDKLGLDIVYVQAKRWQDNVGSPEVMKFCGGLTAHHAGKGVLITTSHFSKDALEFVTKIPQKIVLIGGRQLAELMIQHNVGVAPTRSYTLKRIDQDYFENL